MQKAYTKPQTKLHKKDYTALIQLALREDKVHKDITSLAVFNKKDKSSAVIVIKEKAIVAGMQVAVACFKAVDKNLKVELHCQDGDIKEAGQKVLSVSGRTLSILAAERVSLNFLALLSGLAQRARQAAAIAERYNITILDTRKTIPAYRRLSKYAMHIGGVVNHRAHLADMGLLKDNHIAQARGITKAIKKFRKKYPHKKIEVEVENQEQLAEALAAQVDMILLDNMSTEEIHQAALTLRKHNQKNNSLITCEASGGISLEKFSELENTHVDYASIGRLTSQIIPVDFSLDILPK